MDRLISCQAAIDTFHALAPGIPWDTLDKIFAEIPSAQPELSAKDWQLIKRLRSYHNGSYAKVIDRLVASAQPMRKKGRWTEKHHASSDEESVIEEWQSCCCSECGRYDTRPYMYYFSTPNYCSYCGADMRGDADEN